MRRDVCFALVALIALSWAPSCSKGGTASAPPAPPATPPAQFPGPAPMGSAPGPGPVTAASQPGGGPGGGKGGPQLLVNARLAGAGFSVPLPRGYARSDTPPAWKAPASERAVLLTRTTPGTTVMSEAAIQILPATGSAADDDAACMARGGAVTSGRSWLDGAFPGLHVAASHVANGATGKTCELRMIAGRLEILDDLLAKPATHQAAFEVTCVRDIDDRTALVACRTVLGGWKFE